MSALFPRSVRALDPDGWRPIHIGAGSAVAILLAWVIWFTRATLPLFVVSTAARLEVDQTVYTIASPVDGEVRAVFASLGREVREGDVLLELDMRKVVLRKREEQLKASSARRVVEGLRAQTAIEETALAHFDEAAAAARREAAARVREADAMADTADANAQREYELFRQGFVAESEWNRVRTEALRLRASSDSFRQAATRIEAEQTVERAAKVTSIERLRAELARAQSAVDSAVLTAEVYEEDLRTHVIRSPVRGRVGEIVSSHPGTVVRAGDRLTAIVPAGGRLAIIAEYKASDAIGRVRPGQKARARLTGFAPIEYGYVGARVRRVAAESREGRVRVELEIVDSQRRIPLQHGQPATVEIETERVSPARLFIRVIGAKV